MTATPTRPTTEQIQRVLTVLDGSADVEDVQDAIDVIWGEERPSPENSDVVAAGVAAQRAEAEAKKAKPPTVMVTEFPDDVVIGWDHCSQCNAHVKACKCKDGPKELRIFEQWRTGTKIMPAYGASSSAPPAATTPVAASSRGPLGDGDLGRAGNEPADIDKSMVMCVIGKHQVPFEEADQNDDGTWTCWQCQESGAQRGVQVDG